MPSSNVVWAIDGSIATLTFNRPHARNALTWDMYDAVAEACDRVDASADIRVLVLNGAGGTFSSGTDIAQFTGFDSADDGIAYERRLDAVIDRVERVTRITVAAIDGVAAGGGCAIALACDFRVCASGAQLGIPVARTLGNCLSAANLARLVDRLGTARATDLLLSGRWLSGEELVSAGLATKIVSAISLHDETMALARDLATRAPSTVLATKALLQRLRDHRRPPPADDVIGACYDSASFREGVKAFNERRKPNW